MFPQSELDNYKLQVELLQEKLQRSEISRQQLEHKLEKLLQRREEHEKIARSKAKQKYQQFLEEQQRRNERNKQLVQMLERIEKQTEIMNSRSERLKMMKLQYEMYFANLVHSQTRRCIQSSFSPVIPIMTTTSIQPQTQNTMSGIKQTEMDGNNYISDSNMPMMATYQRYPTMPSFEKDQYTKEQQTVNMPYETIDMPTLANLQRQDRKVEKNPAVRYEQLRETNENNVKTSQQDKHINNNIEFNTNTNFEPATHLLTKDKELADLQNSAKLSPTTSLTFEEIPNVKMMSEMQIAKKSEEYIPEMNVLNKNNLSKTSLSNEENSKQPTTPMKPIEKSTVNITANNNKPRDIENRAHNIETPLSETQIEDRNTSEIIKEPLTSFSKIGQIKAPLKTSPNSAISTQNPKPEINETLNLPTVQTNKNSDENSSSTKMSIENIENAIYGELLLPLEKEQEQKQESNSVNPKLYENLVTQPVIIEEENNVNLKQDSNDKLNNEIADSNIHIEENSNNENTESNVTYEEYSNTQQNESNNGADYDSYENIDSRTVIENQEEQQYDYSNYDPTQYSYPGYIYDETTGEYKPDPNAPAEQYATDQQYAAESYDQQYQQQNTYDYDQTYATEPTSNLDNTAYNNYESTQVDTSNVTNLDTNIDQQNPQQREQSDLDSQQQQPLEETIENTPENISRLPTKITKPTSILSTADKNDNQKKRKRVNFVDSSEADESVTDKEVISKPKTPTNGSSESDFDFSSSTEGETKAT